MVNLMTSEIFTYELWSFQASLFEAPGLPREASKPAIANIHHLCYNGRMRASWNERFKSPMHVRWRILRTAYSLVQRRLVFKHLQIICKLCKIEILRCYHRFYGYPQIHSTKDVTNIRRTKTIAPQKFNDNMPCKIKMKYS